MECYFCIIGIFFGKIVYMGKNSQFHWLRFTYERELAYVGTVIMIQENLTLAVEVLDMKRNVQGRRNKDHLTRKSCPVVLMLIQVIFVLNFHFHLSNRIVDCSSDCYFSFCFLWQLIFHG